MAGKSDSRRDRRLSATQASRSFSKLLDEVEEGRRFVIFRHGRDICAMLPPQVTARRASECLALLRGRASVLLDDRFGQDLLDIVAREGVEERPSWDS